MDKLLLKPFRQFSFLRPHFFAKCLPFKCSSIFIFLVFFFAANKMGERSILLKNVRVKFNITTFNYRVEIRSNRNNQSKMNGVEKFNISHHALPQKQFDGVSKQLTIVI